MAVLSQADRKQVLALRGIFDAACCSTGVPDSKGSNGGNAVVNSQDFLSCLWKSYFAFHNPQSSSNTNGGTAPLPRPPDFLWEQLNKWAQVFMRESEGGTPGIIADAAAEHSFPAFLPSNLPNPLFECGCLPFHGTNSEEGETDGFESISNKQELTWSEVGLYATLRLNILAVTNHIGMPALLFLRDLFQVGRCTAQSSNKTKIGTLVYLLFCDAGAV